MLLRVDTRDKEPRRNELSDYEVILLLGDNLGDFHQRLFLAKTIKADGMLQ